MFSYVLRCSQVVLKCFQMFLRCCQDVLRIFSGCSHEILEYSVGMLGLVVLWVWLALCILWGGPWVLVVYETFLNTQKHPGNN